MKFQGATYSEPHDKKRLSSQLERVRGALLAWGQPRIAGRPWWTLEELQRVTGGSLPGISARLRDLRKPQFGGYTVERRRRGDPKRGLFEYRLLPPGAPTQLDLLP